MCMKEQVLSTECKRRGFTKCGKSYIRVVGDGVFQHILFRFKERLHSSSPEYSLTHRYEPRILIFLKSMYARYDDDYISIDRTTGFAITVPQLLDKRDSPFMSSSAEMERMLNEGLDTLGQITTQRQIIEYLEPLTYDERECQQYYSTQLYDMYLCCEEFYKARMAVETEFAQNYFGNMGNCKKNPEQFSDKMRRFLGCAESYYEQYMLTFPAQYSAVKARLQNNYEVNFCRLKEIGIL